ncbi:S46 family peptidase [Bacteroidota bacterium]
MRIARIILGLAMLLTSLQSRADEGMWLLSLLEGYTIEDMQSKGFRLTAEDIYSVNQACLKDAVVIFGGGCTGEMISADGLLLTNHHCGYGRIQSHSSVENDYLTDGFWAMSREEELPNEGLSVQFLRYMKDVSDEVLAGMGDEQPDQNQENIMGKNIKAIVSEAEENGKYRASVRPMFYGNQYYLFVYEQYNDVRLVGAPPSSIGNFGEDNDNWMWPRHTGDFSLFRVYANENNEPATYSPDNIPYEPRKFFEISMDGIEQGDFTMILGYPGYTQQFLYSGALQILQEISMPLKIDIRTQRMNIMEKYMNASDEVRIQYASKYRGVTNAWKKWQGAIKGLERLDAVNRKLTFEKEFKDWVLSTEELTDKYAQLLDEFGEIYSTMGEYQVIDDLIREALLPIEQFRIAATIQRMMYDSVPADVIRQRAERLYKDYYAPLDQEMMTAMLSAYRSHAGPDYRLTLFNDINKKYKGSAFAYSEALYKKSPFTSLGSLEKLLNTYENNYKSAMKILGKDQLLKIYAEIREIYSTKVQPQMVMFYQNLNELYRLWVQAIIEMKPAERQYPDANFTMRLTYGMVDGYKPEDAVEYDFYTTLSGVIEKSKEDQPDYVIPDRLRDLYYEKDFGRYGVNNTMPVCFTASNHTSGGNSGSPVLNADGRLIGINFDRNWHGTMSDEMYDPDMCRNIAVDIRYILFIIDKYAGASYLIDEMVLGE